MSSCFCLRFRQENMSGPWELTEISKVDKDVLGRKQPTVRLV